MKHILIIITIILSPFFSFAQNSIKTEKIKVEGNCSMCKKRIENAAYVKGVKRADWNVEDQTLTVVYNTAKTSSEIIQQCIAKAGHNAENVAALEADYEKLPACCHYKTNLDKH
ncbi:MAG TPA: heavy-metal-associated domain-containing protein [Flavipsychrobacter sp.]|nr:heavy-metal-associated domain-containing protein [Flavipsychrobacter sp.]